MICCGLQVQQELGECRTNEVFGWLGLYHLGQPDYGLISHAHQAWRIRTDGPFALSRVHFHRHNRDPRRTR